MIYPAVMLQILYRQYGLSIFSAAAGHWPGLVVDSQRCWDDVAAVDEPLGQTVPLSMKTLIIQAPLRASKVTAHSHRCSLIKHSLDKPFIEGAAFCTWP